MPNVSKLGKGPKHCPRKLLIFLFALKISAAVDLHLSSDTPCELRHTLRNAQIAPCLLIRFDFVSPVC